MLGCIGMLKPKQSQCPNCHGAGGYYWDAPVYHNERQREWASCGACVHDQYYPQYLLKQGPFLPAKD